MDADRARRLLAQERERIEKAIAELDPESAAESAEPGDRDSEDLYQQEYDEGRAGNLQEQLAAVERAEARLQDGSYGLSVESGAPIPDGRLEVMPTAERTVAEEERRAG